MLQKDCDYLKVHLPIPIRKTDIRSTSTMAIHTKSQHMKRERERKCIMINITW